MDDHEDETSKGNKFNGNKKCAVQYDVPVDRGWSWVVLLGAFGVCTLAIGGLKSFGVLFVELSRTYSVSNRALASIQSLTGFFFLGIGPVSNALSMKYSHRKVVFTGGVITVVGLVLSSFAKSVEVLYITYGVITGIGLGLSFSSTLVIVAYYFDKKRSCANGFSMSGSGIGSTILPYLMRYLMDTYSIPGCFLIVGAIMSHLCLFGLTFRPIYQYPIKKEKLINVPLENNCIREDSEEVIHLMSEEDNSGNKKTKSVTKYVTPGMNSQLDKDFLGHQKESIMMTEFSSQPNISATCNGLKIQSTLEKFKSQELVPLRGSNSSFFSGNASLFASVGVLTSLSCQSIPKSIDVKHYTVKTSQCEDTELSVPAEKEHNKIKKCCQSLNVDWTLFKDPVFIVFLISIFCITFGYHSVFNLLPPYVDELQMSDQNGAFLVAVYGLSDFGGRFLVGFCMDLCVRWKQKMFFLCTLICSVGVLLTPQFDTILGLSLLCGFYGFFGGGYNGTLMSVLVDTLGLERISTSWGFMCFSASLAMFLNPFLSGLMKDVTGTWKSAFQLMGSIATLGSLLLLLQPVLQKRKKKKCEDKTIYIEKT